jgi:hypothetical protein
VCHAQEKTFIGLATVAAIGIAAVPMDASARGGGGGGFYGGAGGGFHSGGAALHGGGTAFHEVWPRVGDLVADLVQLGLLPCPAEQASAECLVEASTTVTTSGTSPFLG